MSCKNVFAVVACAALGLGSVCYAQRFGGSGQGRRGPSGGYYGIRRAGPDSFTGDFTFCRIAFRQSPYGDGFGWGVDYPRADENLSIRFSELTRARVDFDKDGGPNHYVMQATDPELFQCPFVMLSEPGAAYFDQNEAKALRTYMLKGGFLWADDSWGEYAWQHWVGEVRKIFPSRVNIRLSTCP